MEPKGAPPCLLCLSVERTLSSAASVLWAYQTVLGDQEPRRPPIYNRSDPVCWECKAVLKRIEKFKNQVTLAQELLKTGVHRSLSNLTISCIEKNEFEPFFIEVEQPVLIKQQSTDGLHSLFETRQQDPPQFKRQDSNGEPHFNENIPSSAYLVKRLNSQRPVSSLSRNDSSFDDIEEYKLELEPKVEIEDSDVWVGSVHYESELTSEAIVKTERKKHRTKSENFKRKTKKSMRRDGKKETKVRKLCGVNCKKRTKLVGKNKKLYKCLPCSCSFDNEKDWQMHENEKHPEGSEPGCSCQKKKRDRRYTDVPYVHIPPRNPVTGTLDCDRCNSKLKTAQYYRRHYRGHIGHQRFECDICGKVFTLRPQIHSHMKFHFPLSFLCDICGKREQSKHTLQIHMYTHSGLESRPFKCDLCPRKFITQDKLKIHALYHTGVRDFKCDLCSRAYFVKYELTQHLRKRHGVGEPMSGKKPVPRTRSMVRNKPINVRRNNADRTDLGGNESLICNLCGKTYASKLCLQAHKVVHTGDRPFKCPECDQRFKFHSNVLTHVRSMHTAEKVHECATCGARFKLKGNLTAHMKTHSGEKPYACDICNQKFIRSRNLRNHYKVHSQGRL